MYTGIPPADPITHKVEVYRDIYICIYVYVCKLHISRERRRERERPLYKCETPQV